VVGLMACGDAHTCTNPAYGRGQSLALRQAVLITDSVADAGDLLAAGRAYETACHEQVEPWYHFSLLTDQMRQAVASNGRGGGGNSDLARVFSGAGGDPELIRTVMRVMNLLEPPQALIARMPELQAAAAARPIRPRGPKIKRPSRDDLLAVVA
jgi:2-polyprenyl-6-methoxyphenol hydroxylase-like FAD-dependent oxidoreductase